MPERRTIQSLGIHLMRLCLAVERGLDERASARMASRLLRVGADLRWLEPPVPNGALTVAHVLVASDAEAHGSAVGEWARDVWAAWTPHHETVRGWLDFKVS